MKTTDQTTVAEVAAAMCKVMSVPEVAAVLNNTLCIDEDEKLSEREYNLLKELHTCLAYFCPDAVDEAINPAVKEST
jgi:hypothetical protein